MGIEFLKMTAALAVLLGGMFVFLRILKGRMIPKKGLVELLSYCPLGPKRGVGVIKVLKGYLVVGVADENISLLDKLDPDDVEAMLGDDTDVAGRQAPMGIKDLFKGRFLVFFPILLFSWFFVPGLVFAAPAAAAPLGGGFFGLANPLELMIFLTLLSLLPALLVMCTCFTRIVVVLSLLRQATGTPQVPPQQVLVGLSLFITFFVMSPVFDRIYSEAYVPYSNKEIGVEDALNKAGVPLKEFMLRQAKEKDIALFLKVSKSPRPATPMDLPMRVVIPSFAIGELQRAFEIGFLIYLPFLVIDMVVGSILLSIGMMMLPPVMVSLPIKLLLFVLADGWGLIIGALIGGFK